MYNLENTGYANITGLKSEFAIEVDEYDDKEKLIHKIFEKSRVANTELFAIDVDIVKSLLSSFDGTEIFPEDKTKKAVFVEATEEMKLKNDNGFLPDGEYKLRRNVGGFGEVHGMARVQDGVFTILQGSVCGTYRYWICTGN